MDEATDVAIADEMRNRRTFSELVNAPLLLSAYDPIYGMIQGLNQQADTAAVLYGGRAWNHHFAGLPGMSAIEQNAVLRGNFDILVLTTNRGFFGSQAYSKLLTTLSTTVSALNAALRGANTSISFYIDAEQKHRTIGYSAVGLFCYIDRIGVSRRRTAAQSTIDKERLFLYVEIAVDDSFGIEYFKRFFVDWSSMDRPLKANESGVYLSLTGLFVLSRFISEGKRVQEKKINVDAIRSNMLLKYRLPELLRNLKQPNIEAAISHVMFVVWPYVFASPAYTDIQATIFMRLLEEFECNVEYDGATIPFGLFLARFNNDIILGQGPTESLPSFRQIVQWLITSIQLNSASDACYLVGGDAIRRYDASSSVSADIDAKCYTTNPHTADRVMLILLVINFYLIQHNYFRQTRQYTLRLNDVPFTIEFNSDRQDLITSVRVLNDFITLGRRPVPLMSIDVRIKYTISYGNVVIGSKIVFTPLDISFWPQAKAPYNLLLTDADLQLITGVQPGPHQTHLCFRQQAQFYQTPVISFMDELEDLRALTTTQQASRAAVGKKEKDLRRFALFRHLYDTVYSSGKAPRPAYINDVPTRLIQGLEQITVVDKTSPLLKNSTELMEFYSRTIRDGQTQHIDALSVASAAFVAGLFAGAKRILAVNRRFKTPFGSADMEMIASHNTDAYVTESIEETTRGEPISLEKTWPVSPGPSPSPGQDMKRIKRSTSPHQQQQQQPIVISKSKSKSKSKSRSKSKSKTKTKTRRTNKPKTKTRTRRRQSLVETILPLLP